MPPAWDDLMRGIGCPLCAPRPVADAYKLEIATLSISTLYLDRDQRFRGYSVLIFDPRHATGLEHLSAEEYAALTADLHQAAKAVYATFRPDLMNYASLGNGIPHVHWHIIPRYHTDERWGYPVWATTTAALEAPHKVRLSDQDYAAIIQQIRANLL